MQCLLGSHSPRVIEAYNRGTHWEKAVIQGPGVRWTLTDVVVARYETSGGGAGEQQTEVWTIAAADVAFG